MQTLDSIKTKRLLLWCSFVCCLGVSILVALTVVDGGSMFASLLGLPFLLPWLMHRAFLRPKLDLFSEANEHTLGGFIGLILASGTVVNVALIFVGLLYQALELFDLHLSQYFGTLLMVVFVGGVMLFFYVLAWSQEHLSRITYYLALRRSILLIALPAVFLLGMVAIQPDFIRFLLGGDVHHERSGYYLVVLFWCGLLLGWASLPSLYLMIMAKTYREYRREAMQAEAEELDLQELKDEHADWYSPEGQMEQKVD